MRGLVCMIAAAWCVGCGGASAPATAERSPAAAPKPAAPAAARPEVIGKWTKEIGKYDPNDKSYRIASLDVKYSNPVTGALEAYGPMVGQIGGGAAQHNYDVYKEIKGRHLTYKEYVAEIVNNPQGEMKMPMLPGGKKYMFDEVNHKILIVEPVEAEEPSQR